MTAPTRLLWLDLETTGLDPDADCILELAAVLTGPYLQPIRTRAWLVRPTWCDVGGTGLVGWSVNLRTKLARGAVEMHERSGLLAQVEAELGAEAEGAASALTGVRAIQQVLMYLLQTDGDGSRWTLAGSSPHFDRAFLRRHMPRLDAALHYRHFDVSTLHAFAELYAPEHVMPRESEPAHRALDDIEHSLRVARWYRDKLGTGAGA